MSQNGRVARRQFFKREETDSGAASGDGPRNSSVSTRSGGNVTAGSLDRRLSAKHASELTSETLPPSCRCFKNSQNDARKNIKHTLSTRPITQLTTSP